MLRVGMEEDFTVAICGVCTCVCRKSTGYLPILPILKEIGPRYG
ncbi:hypothetical protein ANDA3_2196 [plant metagenome]|uniref:Uncharacterized protein n=2 Tax=root TaxID=1 RepID=A0A1C3JZC2_9BURK|nr:hypothetical protein ODI_01644 [Orrella dioscoreae]SOE49559.1 hypothetical protein ODI_R2158 [Orrella dioscoreae]